MHWAHRYSIYLLLPLAVRPGCQARLADIGRQREKPLPFACQIPPLKFGQIFTLFFYPAGSGPKKRKRQATADPDSKTTSSSDSDSSSTINTSEGEDEKDFILPDYPSEERSWGPQNRATLSQRKPLARISARLVRESQLGRHTVPLSFL